MSLLDQHGLTENTLIVVVSEQGSSFPFAKWTCYDSGLQSALIARWPGKIQPGSVNPAMIEIAGSEHFGIRSVRSETHNLADEPGYDQIKKELRSELDRWMLACGDRGQATEMAAMDRMPRKSGRANEHQPKRKKKNDAAAN